MTETIIRAGIRGDGRTRLHRALSECIPFTTSGALRGERHTRKYMSRWDCGQLNDKWANRFMIDHMAGIMFVVYSYDTPIAWVLDSGEVVRVEQRFSVTTSRHQGFMYLLNGGN